MNYQNKIRDILEGESSHSTLAGEHFSISIVRFDDINVITIHDLKEDCVISKDDVTDDKLAEFLQGWLTVINGFEPDEPTEALEQPFNIRTHNGTITVENTKTGKHRTFEIKTEKFGIHKRLKRVVRLHAVGGSTPFAFAYEDGVKVWSRLQQPKWAKYVAILDNPLKGMNSGLVYHFEGRCRVCNRPLTNPESIKTGIGPVCAGRE